MERIKHFNNYSVILNNTTFDEVISAINKQYPIKFDKGEDLIERIHARYPLVSKTEIAVIINATFESIREFLIRGEIVTVSGLFNNLRIKITKPKKYVRVRPFISSPSWLVRLPA
jgi:nucleoid DNA-binding protein